MAATGTTPNEVNLGPTLLAISIAAVVLTTTAISLRFYVRIGMQRRFAADDCLLLLCQVNFLAFVFCVMKVAHLGVGKHTLHVYLVHPHNITLILKYYFISVILFYFNLCAVKIAFLIFFLSLHPPRYLKNTAIVIGVFTILVGIIAECYHIYHCAPVQHYWERVSYGHAGHCTDPLQGYDINMFLNALNVFGDFFIALLPAVLVWNLNLSKRDKFGSSILLGLGALSAICPFIRSFYVKRMLVNNIDFAYNVAPAIIFAIAETAVALTVVCVAQLRPLYRRVVSQSWSGSSERTVQEIIPTIGRAGRRSGRPGVATHLGIMLHANEYSLQRNEIVLEKDPEDESTLTPSPQTPERECR